MTMRQWSAVAYVVLVCAVAPALASEPIGDDMCESGGSIHTEWNLGDPIVTALFKFPDAQDEFISVPQAETLVYTTWRQWLENESYGQSTIAGPPASGYYMMPHPILYYCPSCQPGGPCGIPNSLGNYYGCNPVLLRNDGDAILNALGYGVAAADFVVYGFSKVQGAWSLGVFGSPFFDLDSIAHEWGHNPPARLKHAGSWTCVPGPYDTGESLITALNGGACWIGRYTGEEPMGVDASTKPFSAYNRTQLGWIPEYEAIHYSSCGREDFVLKRLTGTVGPREIRIQIPGVGFGNWFYSIEYQVGYGVKAWLVPDYELTQQALRPPYSDCSLYWVNNWLPVTPANSFDDSYRGISVEVLSMDTEQAVVRVWRPACPPGGGGGGGGDIEGPSPLEPEP